MSRGKLTGIGSTVVAVITALAVWWLNDGPGASEEPPPVPETSATAEAEPAPTLTPTPSPTEAEPTASDAPSPSYSPTTSPTTQAPDDMPATDPDSGLPYVALGDLPPEAAQTVDLIDAGGPFPYDKDGSTFGNYEGLLPDRPDGYYSEYTVETPGSDDRGARRIVAGSEGELYWTEDHYESFERIWR
ncbi:ribonuclease T1 [Nocardioides thalensis]|uniref:Ribonuclease T1 n=1 Tax=Nocardioides thalensis TaxID=1914755 RepID=A0A853C3M6_9ACTN|nr:ribonuclease domain-containing protein [Nocardioides thalensis]NYJ01899.1 ribonuclease T1 [Nocardioides thalensis]